MSSRSKIIWISRELDKSGIAIEKTSFQMDKTVWGVVSAAVEQSRRKANMVAQGDGKFGP